MKYYLAVDIGASTMRMILGSVQNGKIELNEVYRVANTVEKRGGHLCWNLQSLYSGIIEGLKECKRIGKIPLSVGIDTWAVDYVLLDENDCILGDSVTYRDSRTAKMDEILEKVLPFTEHYGICGIAKQPFNTVYQLMAQFNEFPEHKGRAKSFLMIPDYLDFLLTGIKKNEYTNASSTAMLDAKTKDWSKKILSAAGIPEALFYEKPCEPNSIIGNLKREITEEIGFDLTVIAPATHDTGSAFVSVPAKDNNAVYISSGTWSLLGVENDGAKTDSVALRSGFTNEGGFDNKIRFLKNIMGLWIWQSVHRETNGRYSFVEMAELAKAEDDYKGRIKANDSRFLAPENMIDEIKSALKEEGFTEPTLPQLLSCVMHSLADCYAEAISDLEKVVGRKFTSLNIVGGGSRNVYLNALAANSTGLPVYAGPTEGTALGNLIVQMLKNKEFCCLQAARHAIARSFDIKEVLP